MFKFTNFILYCVIFLYIHEVNALKCNDDQWNCNSGECINSVLLCDGSKHCLDGSDEISENCREYVCPAYAFRCTYGGCVKGTSRCDNVTDCVDGSDEALCGLNEQDIIDLIQGNCSSELEFECRSDECIASEFLCDGEIHCSNGADEKSKICSQVYCPEYAFRCAYGACVTGKAKCNGKIDCADGSDEYSSLCNEKKRVSNTDVSNTDVSNTDVSNINADVPINAKPKLKTCIVPTNSENLIVEYDDTKETIKLGHGVAAGTIINFSCIDKYAFRGQTQNFCLGNGKWLFELPVCRKTCSLSKILNDPSITAVDCNSNRTVSYYTRLDVDTRICLSCAPGYFWNFINNRNEILTCTADGNWDFEKFSCQPECGVLHRENILNNVIPWVVSIYMRTYTAIYEYTCTGTIISPKLVLTANICFRDSRAVLYNIVEGDYMRSYKQGYNFGRKMHNVSEILKPNNIDDGVALMVLINYFTYSMDVKPICLYFLSEEPFKEYDYMAEREGVKTINTLRSGFAVSERRAQSGQINLLAIIGDKNLQNNNILLNINVYKTFINSMLKRYKISY